MFFGNKIIEAMRAVVSFPEVDRPGRHHDPNAGTGNDHRIPRSAEAIAVIRAVLTSPSRRTVTPRTSIETEPI